MKSVGKFIFKASPILIASLCSNALAEPVIYGKANLSLNQFKSEEIGAVVTQDNIELVSNASRFGVKGEKEISEGLYGIYQLELEYSLDDGDASTTEADCDGTDTVDKCGSSPFKQRNSFVGLKGAYGKVIAGVHDTPFKLAQGKVDRFNDLPLGDIKNILSGEIRSDNIVMVSSKDLNGFVVNAAFIPGEEDGVAADENSGIADSSSFSVIYKAGDLWASLALDSDLKDADRTRFAIEYDFGGPKLGVLVQQDEDTTSALTTDGYLVSGEIPSGKLIYKAQFATSTEEDLVEDIDSQMLTAGLDYKMSKEAKTYLYYSQLVSEQEGIIDDESTTLGLGVEIKF